MRAYSHQAYVRPRCRRRAASLTPFHSLRVGNAGGQLVWRNLAQSKTLCTWRSSLCGTWEASSVSGRHAGPAHEGESRTMSMYADEESDEGVVPMKRSNNEGVSSAETVEGRTSPKGNGGQTAPAPTPPRETPANRTQRAPHAA